MEDAIRTLNEQRDEHIERRDRLRADISSVQAIIKQKREAQAAHQRTLEAQARHNVPELRFWENCLGLRIEASGSGVEDQLRLIFDRVEDRDGSKDAWFELNMGGKEYVVPATMPKLEKETLDAVVERLNESRELGPFLKAIRHLLACASKA